MQGLSANRMPDDDAHDGWFRDMMPKFLPHNGLILHGGLQTFAFLEGTVNHPFTYP